MIVSIYIEEHGYLINEPQTINFGGKYIYFFEPYGDCLLIKKRLNQKYIEGFFNISESTCEVNLLSAIVGQNGVGKSSLLDIIRDIFINEYPNCTVLVEDAGETKLLQSDYKDIYIIDENNISNSLSRIDREQYQTIYYSPHFDLKYNNTFSKSDNYDISLDKYIEHDLKDTDKKGTNENGWKFDPQEELVFKNTLRQVEFMISDIFKKDETLNFFQLPTYKYIELLFRDIEIDEDFWNTPNQFRDLIKLIKEKTKSELDNWHELRNFDKNNRVTNQAHINQYILKRFIINAILSVIIRMMEERNSFLNEGFLNEEIKVNKDLSAEELFLIFIKNSFIDISGEKRKIFDSESYNLFFVEIDKVIEKNLDEKNIKNQSIEVKLEDVEDILLLHRKIVNGFFKYYTHYESYSSKSINLYEFIGLRPYNNMSSGELAMLNLFSRLHYFFENNLKNSIRSSNTKGNYILLLDEADLGFHPVWKKKYVDAVLKIMPYFFEVLDPIPQLQIIITTHDPFTLSDLPINNVVFLKKDDTFCSVISDKDELKIQKTFGANITELLAHSFFVENGLIGDFSKSKIKEVIDWINKSKKLSDSKKTSSKFKERLEYYKKVVNLIDEKIVKIKLAEMITDLVPDNAYYNQVIDEEVKFLIRRKKK